MARRNAKASGGPATLRQTAVVETKRRVLLFSCLILVILGYFMVHLIFGNKGLIKYRHLQRTKQTLEQEITAMEKENKILREKTKQIEQDPYYIEKHAREEFNMSKPGEYIFQFQENDK
ncbi:MAG TPA: septum formation initiator family protein [Dissulfurispiraceae bacterium]|nr:septum formation initiator family protein [Dissulfurispiraceae bacterium]